MKDAIRVIGFILQDIFGFLSGLIKQGFGWFKENVWKTGWYSCGVVLLALGALLILFLIAGFLIR